MQDVSLVFFVLAVVLTLVTYYAKNRIAPAMLGQIVSVGGLASALDELNSGAVSYEIGLVLTVTMMVCLIFCLTAVIQQYLPTRR